MNRPRGLTLAYGYDAYGRITNVTSSLAAPWATLANSLLYQPATERPYARRLGNGLVRMVTLDTDARISRLDSPGVHTVSFGYDTTDTLASLTDSIVPALNASFTYDSVDRLAGVTRSGDAQSFVWDKAGNRTSHTRTGATSSYTYTPTSNGNRLASIGGAQSRTFSHDANGNVLTDTRSGQNWSYAYDAFNQLASVTSNGTLAGEYRSNALNQRA